MKTLPLSHFEREGPKANTPIWGINTADQSQVQTSGDVLIAIPNPNGAGQPDALRIPQTWLPQELTRTIPRKRLMAASGFRKAVAESLISLISEETAAKLLRQPGAQEEKARLEALSAHVRKAGAARTIAAGTVSLADGTKDDDDDEPVVIGQGRGREDKSVAVQAAAGVEDVEEGISPPFKMWCDRLNTLTDAAALSEIKARRKFKSKELGFLHRNLSAGHKTARAMVAKNMK